jgi:hypothetical protein
MRGAGFLLLGSALAALAPQGVRALETRYDHRDQAGVALETMLAHDSIAITGKPTKSYWRPALRLAYTWDPIGDGNELSVGLQLPLRTWHDSSRYQVLQAFDARYRAFFGTDELKTFFDVGLWAPVASRLAIGPMVGIGAAYDFSRSGGIYLQGAFATAFGQARIASLSFSAGGQLRF